MLESYKTVHKGGTGEFIMKKSKFISYVGPAKSEDDALEFIESIKKKHWDASHNCTAYIIGNKNVIERCNDDGEPSKTAGKPMLDVLIGQGLTDIVVVVTRYFGGTLLGTGGLVKSYQSATIEGLNNSLIIEKRLASNIEVLTDYNTIGKIQYYLASNNYPTIDTIYTDIVKANVLIDSRETEGFYKKVSELSYGTALVNEIEKVYYAKINNEIHLFK
ncbi:MAG TPA: YigZ family protein [Clostridiales bacterium]|nr:YigZ family protein [Clostridiales bacterium]